MAQTWKFIPSANESSGRTYDPSLYPADAGPGTLGYTNYNPPSIEAFIESLPSIGIPIAIDLNNGTNVGGKHELSTLDPTKQTRVSSYIAFWDTLKDNPKFQVVTSAVVQKVLFHDSSSSPVAYGVEYSYLLDGQLNGSKKPRKAFANKEVILSAGVFKTPQLLMLSVYLSCTDHTLLT